MQTQLPKPPECPPWCRAQHPSGGWTVDDGGTYKRCERHVAVDAMMDYTLETFADVEPDGTVVDTGPYLRFLGIEFPLETAVHCCYAVLELAALAGIIPSAAAA